MGDSSEETHLESEPRSPDTKQSLVFASGPLAQDVEGARHRDVLPNPVSDQERELFAYTRFDEYPLEGEDYALDDAGFVINIQPNGGSQKTNPLQDMRPSD